MLDRFLAHGLTLFFGGSVGPYAGFPKGDSDRNRGCDYGQDGIVARAIRFLISPYIGAFEIRPIMIEKGGIFSQEFWVVNRFGGRPRGRFRVDIRVVERYKGFSKWLGVCPWLCGQPKPTSAFCAFPTNMPTPFWCPKGQSRAGTSGPFSSQKPIPSFQPPTRLSRESGNPERLCSMGRWIPACA